MNGQTSKEANRWTQFAKTGLSNAQSALAAAVGLEHELLNRKESKNGIRTMVQDRTVNA
jgi:hypothetical protein